MVFPVELIFTQLIEVSQCLCVACVQGITHHPSRAFEATLETMFSFAVRNLGRGKKQCCFDKRFVCESGESGSVQQIVFFYFEYIFISVRSTVFSYFEGIQDSREKKI